MQLSATSILAIFLGLKFIQHLVERRLTGVNRNYYMTEAKRKNAQDVLGISAEDMKKTLSYSEDRYAFGRISSWVGFIIVNGLLAAGCLGLFESFAVKLTGGGSIVTGLVFFALLGLGAQVIGLSFELYRVFKIEEKHGFNRQTLKGFILDRIKGLAIAMVLGGLIMSLILWIMEAAGSFWWVYAWAAMSGFSILTAWLYPALLAPLFNKFSPVDGELSKKINDLASKIGFTTAGIYIMDASKRSSHGNAYFTGVFGKKRIVLFDTLVEAMSSNEVVAVLAHELGHFKLKHVRWQLIRGVLTTGFIFYLLSLCLPLEKFYSAFFLDGISNYSALLVFGLWFGLIDFALQPLENYLSRRNEFAADNFAGKYIENPNELGDALLKLREKSNAMPISHPYFSRMYHSHPPILERLQAMNYSKAAPQG